MRWLLCIVTLAAVVGCKNQSTPLANPFLSPDRVPPPATRTLQPGTAQPVYPGDAAPFVPAVGAPSANAPANVYPPGTGVPAPTYAPQSAPVTPPGGWNQPATAPTNVVPYGVQPTSARATIGTLPSDSQPIQVTPDNQSLRFAAVPSPVTNDPLQIAAQQQGVVNTPYVYTPPTPIAQQGFTQPTQFAATPTPAAASDGFRPQGSSQATTPTPASQPNNTALPEDPARFGFDPTYRWLRGQLQYYPQTGYWGVRYVPLGGAADSYGGVAVIDNPEVLGGVQPGEYLAVQGYLETAEAGNGQFLPLFTVEGVQLQQ